MDKHDYICCGAPDGGALKVREHNPVACNPFFLILNRSKLYAKYRAEADIYSTPWQSDYEAYTSESVLRSGLRYEYDSVEPYYPFFFWLCKKKFRILYLEASAWDDEPEGISTLLHDTNGQPFVLHTCYSRDFMKRRYRDRLLGKVPVLGLLASRAVPGEHHERIMRAAAYAEAYKLVEPICSNTTRCQ